MIGRGESRFSFSSLSLSLSLSSSSIFPPRTSQWIKEIESILSLLVSCLSFLSSILFLEEGEKDCSIIFQSSNLETWRPLPSRERSWRDLREQGALHLAETLGWSITRDNRGRGRKGGGGLRLHFILALTNCYLNCISEL